ncbi:MAG TPA: DoxX family protein [Bacteroidales bacterium]|nr:DoxX family protein [Bacteroidales bacterium]
MKLSKALCRLIFGLTFILSGFLKLTDPIGTGLIIQEYLTVFSMRFLDFASIGLGIALSAIEFVIGISILLGLRMRFFTWMGLGFISFFTLLTLYLAIFNPITDCGCFGEAIHLTNWETFYKNLVLLTCALVLFFNRKSFIPIAYAAFEWVSVGLFLGIALLIAIPTYYNIPQIDFTAYKIGTDLDMLTRESHAEYETIFLYSKDGKQQEFGLNDLPDSTWTFVDSRTELISGSPELAQVDISLRDTAGEYRTEVLLQEGPLVAGVIWDPEEMTPQMWTNLVILKSETLSEGSRFILLSSVREFDGNQAEAFFPQEIIYTADRKALMTLVRSNGGGVYFFDGTIIHKWPSRRITSERISAILSEDSDQVVLNDSIHQRLYINILLISIILIVILMRYFCKSFYTHKE